MWLYFFNRISEKANFLRFRLIIQPFFAICININRFFNNTLLFDSSCDTKWWKKWSSLQILHDAREYFMKPRYCSYRAFSDMWPLKCDRLSADKLISCIYTAWLNNGLSYLWWTSNNSFFYFKHFLPQPLMI